MSGSVTFTFSTPNFSTLSWCLVLGLLYVLFGLITIGYYARQSRQGAGGLSILIRGLIFAALWPIYWIVVVGPVATLSIVSSGVGQVRRELLTIYYTLALIFVPAYLIYINWDNCSSFGTCSGMVAKAFLTGLVWPILLAAKFLRA